MAGILHVCTAVYRIYGIYEYCQRSCFCIYKNTVCKLAYGQRIRKTNGTHIVSYNDFPVGIVIFLAVAVICGIILYRTKPGRYILCLGSNSEAVRLSGVNTRKWRMLSYMICGTLVGIAALFFVATYTTVQPGYGDQYNNEAIAGCVMGGTSMVGGLASIGGTVIGVFIISLLQQGIMAFGLGKGQQMIITGIIVIVAVYADVSARRRKN